ncbi:MAG: DUF3267 domain-containing protein [Thermomicrobiales bacterium]
MPRLLRLQDVRATAVDDRPAGYDLAGQGRLDLKLLTILSLVALVPATALFVWLTASRGGPVSAQHGQFSVTFNLLDLVLLIIFALVLLPIMHELVHGAVAGICGGRPVYGIGPGIAFCHFREFVGKSAYAAILVAPLLLISVAGVVLMPVLPDVLRWPVLALLITNASGAVGDLAALAQLLPLPHGVLIADTRAGFEYYLPAGAIPAHGEPSNEDQAR